MLKAETELDRDLPNTSIPSSRLYLLLFLISQNHAFQFRDKGQSGLHPNHGGSRVSGVPASEPVGLETVCALSYQDN